MNCLRPVITTAFWFFLNPALAQIPPPEPSQGVEVLARGPVHEAYAQPVSTEAVPSAIVTQQPPEPINEVSPDQKPEGDNVQWIPGYWAWNDDPGDYIWVSGSWRVPPPGQRWLSGHWQQIDAGWQWVAGFWSPAKVQQIRYLPPPPPTLDQGPAMPAPDANSLYIAGIWVYQDNGYRWRPGHWVGYQPDWVWSPAHYIWTPSGCLFNEGYWDYPLYERGLLFAPVRFGRGLLAGGAYVPQYVVNCDFLIGALFIGPACQHYYFGDYFDNRYQQSGYIGWNDYRLGRGAYDPNFAFCRHRFAGNPGWERGLSDLYRGRRSGEVPRPPRTLVQQIQAVNAIAVNKTGNVNVHHNIGLTNVQNVTALAPLKEVHNMHVTNLSSLGQGKAATIPNHVVRLQAVPPEEHVREQQTAAQMRLAADQRRQTEAKMLGDGGVPVKHTDPPKTVKFEHPNLPAPVAPPRQVQGNSPTQAPPHEASPRPAQREPPPPPTMPKHEERPIPKYEPPHPPAPPKPVRKP